MTTGDIPSIANTAYTNTTHTIGDLSLASYTSIPAPFFPGSAEGSPVVDRRFRPAPEALARLEIPQVYQTEEEVTKRIVQVFIADTDDNVPLADSVLYSGEQKLTDATDQELFFEINIKQVLEAHNLKRIKFVNKKVKERTEYLEPAKIRELKMVVVTVAQF